LDRWCQRYWRLEGLLDAVGSRIVRVAAVSSSTEPNQLDLAGHDRRVADRYIAKSRDIMSDKIPDISSWLKSKSGLSTA
jgi:hypothetical protein